MFKLYAVYCKIIPELEDRLKQYQKAHPKLEVFLKVFCFLFLFVFFFFSSFMFLFKTEQKEFVLLFLLFIIHSFIYVYFFLQQNKYLFRSCLFKTQTHKHKKTE